MPVELPEKDKITVRWLVDNLPISWVWTLLAIAGAGAIACVTLGVEYGKHTAPLPNVDEIKKSYAERDRLAQEIGDLVARREQLKAELTRLQIDIEVGKMTPEQVNEALKKWTR